MAEMNIIDILTIISIILSLVSVVLAVVSIYFSCMFYKWGKEENEKAVALTSTISEKVLCLEKLFDKMYSSTYDIVRENNHAMQKHLFSGSFSQEHIVNKEMEVFLAISSKGSITVQDICQNTSFSQEDVKTIITKMQNRGLVSIENQYVKLTTEAKKSSNMSSLETV